MRVLLWNATSLLLRWKAIGQLLCYEQRRQERRSPLGPVLRVNNVRNGTNQHSNR